MLSPAPVWEPVPSGHNSTMSETAWIPKAITAEDLSTVSSLYGPGTVLGWYLTALGVLVAYWRDGGTTKAGFIGFDLITVLTFPFVAAGHFIFQRCQKEQWSLLLEATSRSRLRQYIFATQASVTVVRSSAGICVLLLFVAASSRQRILLYSVAVPCGLFTMVSDVELVQPVKDLRISDYLFGATFVLFTALLVSSGMYFYVKCLEEESITSKDWTLEVETNGERGEPLQRNWLSQLVAKSRRLPWPAFAMLLVILFGTTLATAITACSRSKDRAITIAAVPRPSALQFVVPRCKSSLKDPGQAVAALAGAFVLGYNMLPIILAKLSSWSKRTGGLQGVYRALKLRMTRFRKRPTNMSINF